MYICKGCQDQDQENVEVELLEEEMDLWPHFSHGQMKSWNSPASSHSDCAREQDREREEDATLFGWVGSLLMRFCKEPTPVLASWMEVRRRSNRVVRAILSSSDSESWSMARGGGSLCFLCLMLSFCWILLGFVGAEELASESSPLATRSSRDSMVDSSSNRVSSP